MKRKTCFGYAGKWVSFYIKVSADNYCIVTQAIYTILP